MGKFLVNNLVRVEAFLVLICLTSVIILGSYSCFILSKNVFEKAKQTELSRIQKANFNLYKNNEMIKQLVKEINADEDIRRIVFESNKDDQDTAGKMSDKLAGYISEINFIKNCIIISPDGRNWNCRTNGLNIDLLSLQVLYNAGNVSGEKIKWYNIDNHASERLLDNHVICSAGLINGDEFSETGKIYFFVEPNFFNVLPNVSSDGLIGILDEKGQLIYTNNIGEYNAIKKSIIDIIYTIYSNENEDIFKFIGKNDKYVLAYSGTMDSDIKFFELYKKQFFYNDLYRLIIVIIAVIIFMLSFISILILIVLRYYVVPLKRISYTMENFEVGQSNYVSNENACKEINIILRCFNKMVDRINRSIQQIEIKESEKRKVEIRAMRYQINPHFIYNTLSSLRIMAMSKGETDIGDSLTFMSHIFKYALSDKEQYVALKTEIKFIKEYIALMNIRYDNRLSTTFLINENAADCYVPTFLLQPIVENSIFHGLNQKLNLGEESRIIIKAYINGKNLVIEIEDNGEGIEQEVQKTILDSNAERADASKKIGVANIRDRLRLLYGDLAEIKIDSKIGEYTNITLILPYDD